jgi:hypothetical protein
MTDNYTITGRFTQVYHIFGNILGGTVVGLKAIAWLYCLHFTDLEPEFCWNVVRLITLETFICGLLLFEHAGFATEQLTFGVLNVVNFVAWAISLYFRISTTWAICNAVMQVSLACILVRCHLRKVFTEFDSISATMLGVALVAINVNAIFYTEHPICELLTLETVIAGWFIYNYVYPNTAGPDVSY